MALRNILKIDEQKCNGCGECVNACAEGAIEIIDGKARLVSEIYCDGLGACIGHCPQDAITIEQREAAGFDEKATQEHLAKQKGGSDNNGFVCPGMMAQELKEKTEPSKQSAAGIVSSQLSNWPIQLKLIPANAPYLAGADVLLVADCVPFAMGDFHSRFLKDKTVVVGCPKLDEAEFYIEKLASILEDNTINSLTVIHMEVPCCSGLTHIASEAVSQSSAKISFEDITISLKGEILKTEINTK